MVVLSIIPHRGNHQRFFPYAGHLGLTPVRVQGVVKTILEEDRKPVKASSLVVRFRCYEADISTGPGKKATHVVYESTEEVWTKPKDEEWGLLGDFGGHFSITIPADAGGVSTATFKNFRSWWQVEAVIYHKRHALLGTRKLTSCQVPLIRHSRSPYATSPPPSWSSAEIYGNTGKGFQYDISLNEAAFGPDEPIDVDVQLHRDDPAITVKRISVAVDRYMIIDSTISSPIEGSDEEDIQIPDQPDFPATPYYDGPSSSTSHLLSQNNTSAGYKRGGAPLPSPTRVVSDAGGYFPSSSSSSRRPSLAPSKDGAERFCGVESDDAPFDRPFTLTTIVPRARSLYKYSLGESIKTKYCHIYFTVSIKIVIKNALGRVETLELRPQVIGITASSEIERQKLLAQSRQTLRVSEAESRIFDSRSLTDPAPPYAGNVSALGARRSSHFALSIETTRMDGVEDDVPSPTRSLGFTSEREKKMDAGPSEAKKRAKSAVRKRSDQWEGSEAPLKSRPRFSTRSSFRGSLPTPDSIGPPSYPYTASHLSQSMTARYSPSLSSSRTASSRTPTTYTTHQETLHPDSPSSFQRYLASSANATHFPLTIPPSPESLRHSRRSARTSTPYSAANRPRSAGALSVMSSRSTTTTSSGGSISGVSLCSTSSMAGRFVRESSTPLPSHGSSNSLTSEILLLPLSLESSVPDSPPLVSTPTFDQRASGVTIPASPAPSSCSDFSDGGTPPPHHATSPAIDFNSFSLQTSAPPSKVANFPTEKDLDLVAPWLNDVSPFEVPGGKRIGRASEPKRVAASTSSTKGLLAGVVHPRRSSTSPTSQHKPLVSDGQRRGSAANLLTSHLLVPNGSGDGSSLNARRKSSGGFGLFRSEEDSPKEGGRWAFLRRGSKA